MRHETTRPFDSGSIGVLSDADITTLVARGAISVGEGHDINSLLARVEPASLDLALGARGYRMRSSFLPGRSGKVEDFISKLAMHHFETGARAVLEPNSVYLVELADYLDLPGEILARANPKSSTGRIDVFVRVIGDGFEAFDEVPSGYRGKLWLEISPRTFPVAVRRGSRLAQMRFCLGSGIVSDDEIRDMPRTDGGMHPFVADVSPSIRNGLSLSVGLESHEGPAGFRARRHSGVIDVDAVGVLDPREWFEPLQLQGGGLILDPGEFYILASHEAMRVPPGFAAEMVSFDAGLAEARVHMAGYMDPGFGWDSPSRAVLEVRTHHVPFLLTHRQTICRIVYERMSSIPHRLYGEVSVRDELSEGSNAHSNHYQGQGLRLSKAFAPWH